MENVNQRLSGSFRLPIVAICDWLLVLPATVFLGTAALRMLQPRQYEPARTSWIIFDWTMTHISRFGAAILFVGMPGIVVVAGCATLLRTWRQDRALREDVTMTISTLRRHLVFGSLMAAVLLGGTILTAVVIHLVAD